VALIVTLLSAFWILVGIAWGIQRHLSALILDQGSSLGWQISYGLWASIPWIPVSLGIIQMGRRFPIHPDDWKRRVRRLPFLLVLGFGISLSNARAVLDGLFSNDSTFIRTPKVGERVFKQYGVKKNKLPLFELLFAAYCALTLVTLLALGQYSLIPFVVIYTLGFGWVGFRSMREARA